MRSINEWRGVKRKFPALITAGIINTSGLSGDSAAVSQVEPWLSGEGDDARHHRYAQEWAAI